MCWVCGGLCRFGLILLGNPRVLSRQPLWNSLLTHFKEHVSVPAVPAWFASVANSGLSKGCGQQLVTGVLAHSACMQITGCY